MSEDYLTYTYNDVTNIIEFTPKPNAFGTTEVTVTLTDADTNIDFQPYVANPKTITQTFDVVLEAVNDADFDPTNNNLKYPSLAYIRYTWVLHHFE